MAEIGVVASVICVASTGFRLSLLLNAVGCDIASAGMDIHSISKGVALFSLMLKQVGQALQASDSVHSAEALETTQEITKDCQMIFDEIQEMLDKVTTKRGNGSLTPSIQQRFKWCFKKGKVQYLLGQLESLKMSLLVMLQILQLGKLMAATPASDQKEEVGLKNETILQERVEAQNFVIVRYWQNTKLDRLFAAAEREEDEDRKQQIEQKSSSGSDKAQLAIEAPPDYSTSTALIKLPNISLGELDTTLNRIRESPKDMLRVSESVIDPLLNRWTRWYEVREQLAAQLNSRSRPFVHNTYESSGGPSESNGDVHEREETRRGHYLEGTTTDWRKPHSVAATQEAAKLRKKYASLQPSISVEGSDGEDDHGHQPPKKAAPSRHVIDSSSETSDSEPEIVRQRRKSNAEASYDKRPRHPPQQSNLSHSYGHSGDAHASFGGRHHSSSNGTPQSTPRSPLSAPRSPGAHRPMTSPVQNQYHHAYTTPAPIHTAIPPNQYTPHSPYTPHSTIPNASLYPPNYPGYNPSPQAYPQRYMPAPGYRLATQMAPQRPRSREGNAPRSPSRHSGHSAHSSQRSNEETRRAERNRKHKNMTKGAAKGVFGAGALAGFLDALEGLEV